MLLAETGHYLFEHTVQNARRAEVLDRVLLATDSDEILRAAAEVGIEAVMTRAAHRSGTDRIREAFERLLDAGSFEVICNIQGDEPELPPEAIETLVACFEDPAVELATLATPLAGEEQIQDPSVVKVVCDRAGFALYFSRAPIPLSKTRSEGGATPREARHLRHIGIYAFRPDALRRFCDLPRGTLEEHECLEQLRWLEAGFRIRVAEVRGVPIGIDTQVDYRLFVERQNSRRSPLSSRNRTP
jgi:3-deoxy-manno-octulosonate cytidylyltransferase (CMP-KDO synthetase)